MHPSNQVCRFLAAIGFYLTATLAQYLRLAIALFRKRHGRPPGPYWHSIPRSGIHALLRLAQGQWPPAPRVTCAADAVRFTICGEYETWFREERGPGRREHERDVWTSRVSATGAASLSRSLQPVTAKPGRRSYSQPLARGIDAV